MLSAFPFMFFASHPISIQVIHMHGLRRLALAALTVALTALTAHAFAKRPSELWSYLHFDGKGFAAGKPGEPFVPFVAVRPGFRPVVETNEERIREVALTEGTGAIAGVCFVQSYGGKLRPAAGYHAVPLLPVPIAAGDKLVTTVDTDGNGFYVAVLPVGTYRVGNQGVEVKVEVGATKLVPLRVGKRMVD